ncbi:hypothetical protein JCM5350_003043 [Sporobolomyces pararoseus]
MGRCTAKATLVYGLTVRSSSLLFAADAWSRLKVYLPFFQLVYLRRRKGGLVTVGSKSLGPVTRVPDEVWEQIRLSLIQEELVDSEIRLLEPLLCTEKDCVVKASTRAGIRWKLLKNKECCDVCCEGGIGDFIRDSIAYWNGSEGEKSLSLVNSLVSDFGLAVPNRDPIHISADGDDHSETLVLVGALTAFEGGSPETGEIRAEGTAESRWGYQNDDEPTVIEASFELPPDIDTRFERLFKFFDLEVVDSSINKLFPRSDSTTEKNQKGKAQTSGVRNKITKTIKPSWKLWTMCEYFW